MEATEKREAEAKEKLKRLESECAENERQIAELTKPLEQPRDLFEYEDYSQLMKRKNHGLDATLDEEIQVSLTRRRESTNNVKSTILTDKLQSSIIDGTVAATISTAAFEVLNQLVACSNSESDELSFNLNQRYKLA
jgi:hypothetical protein